MRHSKYMPAATVTTVKAWNTQTFASQVRCTPCNPFSPPVTSVHLNAISKAIWENASVSNEKYNPRRRRMISAMIAASTSENTTENTSATISLPTKRSIAIATA